MTFLGVPRGSNMGPKWGRFFETGTPFFGFYVARALKIDVDGIWGLSWAQLGLILDPFWAS